MCLRWCLRRVRFKLDIKLLCLRLYNAKLKEGQDHMKHIKIFGNHVKQAALSLHLTGDSSGFDTMKQTL